LAGTKWRAGVELVVADAGDAAALEAAFRGTEGVFIIVGPLPAEAVGRIYQTLVEEMRNREAKLDATASQVSSPAATATDK